MVDHKLQILLPSDNKTLVNVPIAQAQHDLLKFMFNHWKCVGCVPMVLRIQKLSQIFILWCISWLWQNVKVFLFYSRIHQGSKFEVFKTSKKFQFAPEAMNFDIIGKSRTVLESLEPKDYGQIIFNI